MNLGKVSTIFFLTPLLAVGEVGLRRAVGVELRRSPADADECAEKGREDDQEVGFYRHGFWWLCGCLIKRR